MAKNFQNLEHTADLKIQAWGKTLEQVFTNMALGMFENMMEEGFERKDGIDGEEGQPSHKATAGEEVKVSIRRIDIKSNDLESLLVDFLSELVYLSDLNNEVYNSYKLQITNYKVLGKVKGYKVDSFKLEVKAVTYNELVIKEDKGQWLAEVVFDI